LVIFVTLALGVGLVAPLNAAPIDSKGAIILARASVNPKYARVNIDNGSGTLVPALKVTHPNGDVTYVHICEQGLTRDILFDAKKLRIYNREMTKTLKAAAKIG